MDTPFRLKLKVAARVLMQLAMLYVPLAICAFIVGHAIAGYTEGLSPVALFLHCCGLLLIAASTFFDRVCRKWAVVVPITGLVLYLCGTLAMVYRIKGEWAWWAIGIYLLPIVVGGWNASRGWRFPDQTRSNHAVTDDNTPSDEQIRDLRTRVAATPLDSKLRFELGLALFRRGDIRGSIPELQLGQHDPDSRIRAMDLLAEAFELLGMPGISDSRRKKPLG